MGGRVVAKPLYCLYNWLVCFSHWPSAALSRSPPLQLTGENSIHLEDTAVTNEAWKSL